MLPMGVITNIGVKEVIDRQRSGVRQGPGNIQQFAAAAEQAKFAPHVIRSCLEFPDPWSSPKEAFAELAESGAGLEAWVLFSVSKLYGDDDGFKNVSLREGFAAWSRSEAVYFRVNVQNSSVPDRLGLFASGLVEEQNCCNNSLYFSHPGTVTGNHFDDNGVGVLSQIIGFKCVYMFPPQATPNLRRLVGTSKYRRSGFDGDLDDPNTVNSYLQDGEDWQRACEQGVKVVLGPGDSLVIPMFWWHAVKTLEERSVSLITRLDTVANISFSEMPFAEGMLPSHEEKKALDQESFERMWGNSVPHPNAIVKFQGLISKPELNGQHGRVTGCPARGEERYVVQLADQTKIKVKPMNFILVVQ